MSNASCHRSSLRTALTIALIALSISAHAQSDRKPGATTSGNSQLKPRPSCTPQPLLGSWLAASLTFDGEPRDDDEMLGTTLAVTPDRLTIETLEHVRLEFSLEVETGSNPCALHLTPLGASTEPAGWMLFAVEGDRLRLGFHDNLNRRAEAFDSRPDMLVLQLSRQGAAR
jgi:hypothetical protein